MSEKYRAKSIEVEALQITAEFFQLAENEQHDLLPGEQFVVIDSARKTVRPAFSATEAYAGDWIVALANDRIAVVKGHDFPLLYQAITTRQVRNEISTQDEIRRAHEERSRAMHPSALEAS